MSRGNSRREMASDLRSIYTSVSAEEAVGNLNAFAGKWDSTHPAVSQIWKRNWDHIIPFFAFPAEIRKIIYTTNARHGQPPHPADVSIYEGEAALSSSIERKIENRRSRLHKILDTALGPTQLAFAG